MIKCELLEYESEKHLFVILENGQNVLNLDAVRFGMARPMKKRLMRILKDLVRKMKTDNGVAFEDFIQRGVLKKVHKQESTKNLDMWEMREDSHGGRIFFVMANLNIVVVSAVNKTEFSQSQAINREVRRWKTLLKN